MEKNMRPQEASNISLQDGHAGRMNRVLHALNRRHRWQNVRKVLPNKSQGSGKHIIDGGTSEPTTNSSQPREVHGDPKKEKPKIELMSKEANSKSFNKYGIRSLISDEMTKRRGINRWRRSSSPSHSPQKKTNSVNQIKNDQESGVNQRPSTNVTESNCDSPSTTKKKRKCDICAAMLTVSYLRQQGLSHERRIAKNIDENQQPITLKMLPVSDGLDTHYMHSHTPLHSRIGLTKSFSFPIIGSTKRKDFKLEEFKHKLKDCKDIQTTKEKFILPMKQWNDIGFPKPMLTRPASFKDPSSSSQKKNKQNNSKSLKQKIGFVIKDSRKEKKRILMDSVFHKIPYGRKTSKDPKKVSPNKLKSNSTSISGSHRLSLEKLHLKKTSSTGMAMSKYRKLINKTSTRDDRLHHSDHKTRLCVAEDHSFGTTERKAHKRIRSLPAISPSDFMHNQEFPVRPTMEIHPSAIFDEQMSSDHFVFVKRRNVGKETNKDADVNKNHKLGINTLFHQEKVNQKKKSKDSEEKVVKDTKFNDKDEIVDEEFGNHQENSDHRMESSASMDCASNDNEVVSEKDTDHQDNNDNQNESRVAIQLENDKSFNEILGMFKRVSDKRTKQNPENESGGVVRKITKNTTIDKDQGAHKNQEVGQKTLDHHENDKSPLISGSEINKDQGTSASEAEWTAQDSKHETSFLTGRRNSLLEEMSYENRLYMFSTKNKSPMDNKRPKNEHHMDMSAADDYMIINKCLHLDTDSVKNNAEFQFVKEVLERSGFLENELLGEWYSSYQPIDPLLFEEVETSLLQTKYLAELDSMKDEEAAQRIIDDHHLLLFDLINEALLEIHNKTYTYCPRPLTYRSKDRPMPVGCRVLEEVWDLVNMYLSWKQELQPSLDDVVSRDLEKGDGWMNLQPDSEFVGVELEEMIADDLLDELVFDDLLM